MIAAEPVPRHRPRLSFVAPPAEPASSSAKGLAALPIYEPAPERVVFPRDPRRPVQTRETPGVPTPPRQSSRGAGRLTAGLREPTLSPTELAALPVRPGSWAALGVRELGCDPNAIADATDWQARARALKWAAGVQLPCRTCKGTGRHDDGEELVPCPSCDSTGLGRDRGRAIAMCGRPALAMTTGGMVGMVGLRCRDRACPRCQRLRAIERAAELKEAMAVCPACEGSGSVRAEPEESVIGEGLPEDGLPVAHSEKVPCRACGSRGEVPWRWQFATLTVPKVHATERDCRASLEVVLDAWRQLTRKSHALGREFSARFHGGVRSIEVVYRARGDEVRYPGGRVHVVKMTGWHVHVHALVETTGDVDDDEARGWLVQQWLALTGGSPRGQCVRAVERGDTGCAVELCKYVAKPLSMDMSATVGRELFSALHGRRLLEGFGRWRGWRKLAKKPSPSLLIGPSVGALLGRMHGDVPNPVRSFLGTVEGKRLLADERRDNPRAIFEGHVEGTRWTIEMPAEDAWGLLRTGHPYAAVPEQVRARGLDPPAWERDPFMWSRCTIGTT